jgi:iron complex transport system ATP-binding protein
MSAPLTCRSVSVVRDGKAIVNHVTLQVTGGSVTGLLGPNGAGKSTLLRTLAGVIQPTSGSVELLGRPLRAWRAAERASHLAYLPQMRDVAWRLSVLDVVALGRLHHASLGRLSAADRAACQDAMRDTDVTHLALRDCRTLSGGELGRVLLARALATGAGVLLADEPGTGLDPRHQLELMEVLRARSATGVTCCVVLHDLTLAARYCDQVILIDQGVIVSHGSPKDVLTDERLASVYGIRALRFDGALVPMQTVRDPSKSARDQPNAGEQ